MNLENEKTSGKLSSFVKVFDDALTVEQCDSAIKYFDDNEEERASLAEVYSEEGTEVREETRKVMEIAVEFQSTLDVMIQESCGRMLGRYVESVEIYPIESTVDCGYSINKYYPKEHYYKWHVDTLPGKPRTVSLVWYLNDVEEGGETEFSFGLKVKPKKGSILMFPSNFCFLHRACVPISGPKYIALTFIGDNRG